MASNEEMSIQNSMTDSPTTEGSLRQTPSAEAPTTEDELKLIDDDVRPAEISDCASDGSVELSTDPRVKLRHRLGPFILVALSLGTVVIFGALIFLWYLWTGDSNNNVWRRIMVHEWVTRVISLLALAIRISAAAQGVASTSMMAAVALERGYFVLPQASAASSLRYLNDGPQALLLLFCRRGWSRRWVISTYVLLLTITSALSQFTSTVLLSDLKSGLVDGNYQTVELPYGFNMSYNPTVASVDSSNNAYLFAAKPPFYPTFAELSDEPYVSDGVSDTGMTLRALLPIETAEDRQSLRNYTGMATIFDSRVTCVRPSINLSSFQIYGPYPEIGSLVYLNGLVGADATFPRGLNLSAQTDFSCVLVFTTNLTTDEWAVTSCGIGLPGGSVSPFQDLNQTVELNGFVDGSVWDGYIIGSITYLVINTTGSQDDWMLAEASGLKNASAASNATGFPQVLDIGPVLGIQRNEWLDILPLGNSSGNLKISLSLCYSNVLSINTEISAFSDKNRTEPSITWNASVEDYETTAVRTQLGGTIPAKSIQERGIMQLEPRISWEMSFWNTSPSSSFYETEERWFGWTSTANTTVNFCLSCFCCTESEDALFVMNRYQATLFQHIFQVTGKITMAMQAYIHTMFQIAYYDDASQFDLSAPMTIQSFVPVLIPSQFLGLIAVTSVLVAHILLVGISVLQFRSATQFSMLRNSWQSMAQTRTPATEGILNIASSLSDSEIEKNLQAEGKARTHVAVMQLDGNDRVGIQIVE